MENAVMLNAVCNEPVSLKVVQEPFYRKGFSPFVNKQTGTWWEYDDDKKGFFDTGIIAQGRDGNDYVMTEQDYNTIVERTLSNVNPTLDEKLSSKLPKSPANWEPWTAEEQAAARERMGIPGDYELIEEIVCDGEVSLYDRKLEPDGTPYAFRSIYCELEIRPSNVYSGVFFRAFDADRTAVLYDGMSTTKKTYTSYAFAGCYAHSGFYRGWMASANGAESNKGGSSIMRINKPQIALSPIKNILINHNTGVFFDGDKIRIYGVRA